MKRVKDRVTLEIIRLGINGEGVGYLKGQVVFVDGALPGEKVIVEATEIKDKYAKAKVVKFINRSNERIKGKCSIYSKCGGCTLQHYQYQAQLDAKREIVKESFEKYLGKKHEIPEIKSVLGMDNPWQYRNKAQIPLAEKNNKVIVGLYRAGSNRIIEMKQCMVHHPELDKAIQGIKEIVEELKIPIYDPKKKKGQLRNIVARISFATREMQVVLVTFTNELKESKELVKRIAMQFPKVVSIAQNINPAITPLVMGDKTKILWGKERLVETIGEIKYSLSPRSFFQLNPTQMEVLYNEVSKAAQLTGEESVLDAYCGAGTLSLWLAKEASEVRGVEVVADAIKDAKYNAELNNITNVHFSVGNVERVLPKWVKKGYRADVIVVDPPRTGLGEKLLTAINDAKPKKIIYVSCNPATLAKDCKHLIEKGYNIEYVQPVDMFPQTSHVESVALLTLKCVNNT
ncbi:23S rRNA (uracil-5-)-methyltransferase RumA [Vulcanibacillus modesticaldus]|uniref:23S rRNA (Uracil-5-)-methyltransferase RumA n=2 Tax=Vulcanibacillus modesticaldus TaxID=337097 RepID=A0A1D2YU98_9BACI|nr:23S rRNA (uracil-5-)-methyltransferase RumA [Vulcanibacillus modesticaldus]